MTEIRNENHLNLVKAYSMMLSFAGSFILYQPQKGCIDDLIESNLFRNLPLKSDNPRFIMAASILRKLDNIETLDYDLIMSDHFRLFGDKGKALASPFGSVYLSDEHLLFENETIDVRKTYNAYGWKSSMEGKIPDDHLGLELQFINMLLEKFHELDDGICVKELNTDLQKFIENNISPWINDWNDLVQKNAASDFYKGISYLTVACIEDIFSLFQVQEKN